MAGMSLAWGWVRVTVLLMLGFYGLSRLAELYALRWSHFRWPSQHGLGHHVIAFVPFAKTIFTGSRRQVVKIDVPQDVSFLFAAHRALPRPDEVWPHAARFFQSRFKSLCTRCTGRPGAVLPSSLRAGGATWLFQHTQEDVLRTMWRGRRASHRTLNHYIQELQSSDVFGALAPDRQAFCLAWMSTFPAQLIEWTATL
jgi:hypothetical protein